jgi:hypothetical protein
MNNNEIPTPRTNSVEFQAMPGMMPPYNTVPSAFARTLERDIETVKTEWQIATGVYNPSEAADKLEDYAGIKAKLERELAQAQQREARLREAALRVVSGTPLPSGGRLVLEVYLEQLEHALTQSPGETMVPWSVVRPALEQFELCYDDATSYGKGDADEDYQAAINSLKAYAPKEKGQP